MEPLPEVIKKVVLEVAQQRTPAIDQVKESDKLVADLGLKSLDLAQLVAMLEMQTGLDPFAERVAITSVRTVGDMVSAYDDEPAEEVAAEAAPEERASRRSRARQSAADRRKARSST